MTPSAPDADLFSRLRQRGSVRDFKPDPLPDGQLETLLAAAQRSPTSSNLQACSVVVVRDPRAKERLAALAGNQQHIVDCPVFLALCADLTRAERACRRHGKTFAGHTYEIGLVAHVDAALVGMSLCLAADAMGLGTVMIGAMRNRPIEVADVLGLPPRVAVTFGMCVGYARTPPAPKPRLPLATFVHHERYDATTRDAALTAYDATLADHYREQGRQSPDAAWTAPIANSFSVARRAELRRQLQELGFPLE